ncbi:hypothetical protein J4458_07050 [Candidatus Woesearchaeota archaeon]|nr:hypothetical protein [Candidatus Woesearchaeota archaeon]
MDIPRLTEEELKAVQDCWINKDEVSFLEVALQSPNLRPHFLALNSHRVIEIGPGKNPVTDHYSCREYFAANDRYPSDGLTVLKKENDASAVVVSFGVIDDDILKDDRRRVRKIYLLGILMNLWVRLDV